MMSLTEIANALAAAGASGAQVAEVVSAVEAYRDAREVVAKRFPAKASRAAPENRCEPAPENRCEPAHTIIKRLGGLTEVARAAGVSVHCVLRWRAPAHMPGKKWRGTGGTIPYPHIPALLRLAADRGVDLSAADFAPAPVT